MDNSRKVSGFICELQNAEGHGIIIWPEEQNQYAAYMAKAGMLNEKAAYMCNSVLEEGIEPEILESNIIED